MSGPVVALPAGVPAWGVAIPLWAAGAWLWIAVPRAGSALVVEGASDGRVSTRPAAGLADLPAGRTWPLIVLDRLAHGALPTAWWPWISGALAPGGVCFVCGPRRPALPEAARTADPALWPGPWHRVSPRQDGGWYLHPATRAFRRLPNRHWDPPYGLRTWLREVAGEVWPPRSAVDCLPVWRATPPAG